MFSSESLTIESCSLPKLFIVKKVTFKSYFGIILLLGPVGSEMLLLEVFTVQNWLVQKEAVDSKIAI